MLFCSVKCSGNCFVALCYVMLCCNVLCCVVLGCVVLCCATLRCALGCNMNRAAVKWNKEESNINTGTVE